MRRRHALRAVGVHQSVCVTPPDGGTTPDAGADDAGAPDAGADDAGATTDAGTDLGARDAGGDAGLVEDAGARAGDAGADGPYPFQASGCSAVDGLPGLACLLLLVTRRARCSMPTAERRARKAAGPAWMC